MIVYLQNMHSRHVSMGIVQQTVPKFYLSQQFRSFSNHMPDLQQVWAV